VKAAFGQPGFRLLFTGLLASKIGDSLMLIVLAVWVKELTGSNGAAGLTFFFLALPSLVAPPIGMMVDRFRRRTMLFWGNLASALAVAPLLLVHDRGDVWILYAVAFLYGISFIALPAGVNGLLKEMLPDELLVDANASLSTSKEALRLVGPLIGAGLYTAFGGGTVAVLDAATFVIAALVVRALKVPEDLPVREEAHLRDEVMAGVRHIRRDGVLLHTLIAIGVALLVIGFMESAVFSMVDAFDKPASWVGVVVSVQGVGAVAGGLCSSMIVKRLGEANTVCASLFCFAGGLAICAASPLLSVVFAGVAVLGFALPVFIVAFNTLMQRRTPNRLMGRVSAAADVVLGTPQAISIAVGALLVSLVSYRTMYWMCGGVIALSAAYLVIALGRVDAAVLTTTADVEAVDSSGRDGEPDRTPATVPDGVVTTASATSGAAGAADGSVDERREDRPELEAGRLDGQRNQ
jgi:MFS family permease